MNSAAATVHQVDAFTAPGMSGNPAGVCLLDWEAEPSWMQAIATVVGYPETAFALVRGESGGVLDVDLRWFTPTVEIELCGHATLATTAVLGSPARFATLSGVLRGRPVDDGASIELPGDPPRPDPSIDPGELAHVLGTGPVSALSRAGNFLVADVPDRDAVLRADPDLGSLEALSRSAGVHGAVVVCALDPPSASPDGRAPLVCASRVFAPAVGIPEDPATGSAHAHLAHRFAPSSGATVFGEQCSPRGGIVGMALGSGSGGPVTISGAVRVRDTVHVAPGTPPGSDGSLPNA